jgi:fructose/tagatose bisphosphate aldolase
MEEQKIKKLAWNSNFGKEKKQAQKKIREIAKESGIFLSSTNNLYKARSQEQIPLNFTVPAFNIRTWTYDVAKLIFKIVKKKKVGLFVFEIAQSEIDYTNQSPSEYSSSILAAAISENYKGPIFIQGDHFQIKTKDKKNPTKEEIKKVKDLIKESIEADFYNIDLDISTLVDYSKTDLKEQQKLNYSLTAGLAEYARSLEPENTTISLGGEIGHIGGKNSTKEELEAFIQGFNNNFKPEIGLSKISVQTGTSHGGTPLDDGSLAEVNIDFQTLKKLSKIARKHKMGGAVQHGASTLPEKYFSEFPKTEAIEIHLGTEFQNIIMDHPKFPKEFLNKIYNWLDKEKQKEKGNQTQAQFYYNLRKKGWGEFKEESWSLPNKIKKPILKKLEKKFSFIFKALNVENTQKLINKYERKN